MELAMKFDFNVGTQEQHHVEFEFDQVVGNLKITVDGNSIVKDFRTVSLSLVKRYEFVVGVQEQHTVAIEKQRKLLLAGLRKQKYRVFVDGKLIQSHEG
jgi:hypothetical protein